MKTISFSIANRVNVNITPQNEKVFDFIEMIYRSFPKPTTLSSLELNVSVKDVSPTGLSLKLGKDAVLEEGKILLNTGHYFTRKENVIEVIIPLKVKRGRIPFKRDTPGRHITDEIVEPILKELLQELDAAFLHASSYVENDKATVVMAWRATGKTQTILKLLGKNKVLSDDLAILDTKGKVYAYPRPIRVYSYNIIDMPFSNSEKKKLYRKARLTPPWQPVVYYQLEMKDEQEYPLGELKFLNNIKQNVAVLADHIIEFEYAYFNPWRKMLQIANILKVSSTEEIISKSLKSMNDTKEAV